MMEVNVAARKKPKPLSTTWDPMESAMILATEANIPPIAWPVIAACMYLEGNRPAKPNSEVHRIELPAERKIPRLQTLTFSQTSPGFYMSAIQVF